MTELLATINNDFPRPIPVTAMALRPARQNCEGCHWSGNVVGARHVRRTYFLADEQNTPWEIHMTVPIGGAADDGVPDGAHWHVATTVEYTSDATGQTIPWVRSVDRVTGAATVYTAEGQSPNAPPASEVRTMDCVDCHNRPSHQLRSPDESVDAALAAARIDRALPYVKQQGVAALMALYPSHEQARQGIDRALRGYYEKNHPQVYQRQQPSIAAAISSLQDTYDHEFFPEMNVQWNTYPTNDGHLNFAGCDRCHDGQHKSVGGRVIPSDCATCHQIRRAGDAREHGVRVRAARSHLQASGRHPGSVDDGPVQRVSYRRRHVIGSKPTSGVHMNGNRGLRVLAFLSIAIGIGILSRPAWGFVAFGVLVLVDAFISRARRRSGWTFADERKPVSRSTRPRTRRRSSGPPGRRHAKRERTPCREL